jgi:hypothetical protein
MFAKSTFRMSAGAVGAVVGAAGRVVPDVDRGAVGVDPGAAAVTVVDDVGMDRTVVEGPAAGGPAAQPAAAAATVPTKATSRPLRLRAARPVSARRRPGTGRGAAEGDDEVMWVGPVPGPAG